jgi:small-conductance mechanosensitive channel
MTKFRFRTFGWLVLAAAMWPATALAQEQPAQEPAAQDTAAVPTGPTAIPAAEIAQRSELATVALLEIAGRLVPDPKVEELDSLVPLFADSLSALAIDSQDLAELRIHELEALEQQWRALEGQLRLGLSVLEKRSVELEAERDSLATVRGVWQATLESAEAQELPEASVRSVESLLAAVDSAEAQARERRNVVLTLQTRLSEEGVGITTRLADIHEARRQVQLRILAADSPPLWKAFVGSGGPSAVAGRVRSGWRQKLSTLDQFVSVSGDRIRIHLIVFVLLLAGILELRRRSRQWELDEETFGAASYVMSRPVSAAFLVSLMFSAKFYPNAPSIVGDVLRLSALIPVLRLAPGLVPASLKKPLYHIVLVFFLYEAIALLLDPSPLRRFAEFGLAATAVWLLARDLRGGSGLVVASESQWWHAALRVAPVAALIFGASLLANLLGFVYLSELLTGATIKSAFVGVAIFLAVKVVGGLVPLIVRKGPLSVLKSAQAHGDTIIRNGQTAVQVAAALLFAWVVLRQFGIWNFVLVTLTSILTAELSLGSWGISLGNVIAFGVAIWVSFAMARLARAVLDDDVLPRMHLPRGVPNTISALSGYVVLFIGFMFAAGVAEFDLGKVTILVGALGVGIGFGLQNIVNNFISGLILMFERPIQIGDTVEVDDLLGIVKHIGIRASIIRTFDEAEVIVPNADLIQKHVINWTLSDRRRRIQIPVGVAYGTPPQKVLDILIETAKQHEDVLKSPIPYAIFNGFGESSLDFTVRFWTDRFDRWWLVSSEVAVMVNDAIVAAGIEIPFPQRDLHVRSVDEAAARALTGGASTKAKKEKQGE